YLKTAVRNAACNFYRRNRFPKPIDSTVMREAIPDAREQGADRLWFDEWRESLFHRAMLLLMKHQARFPRNLSFTILNLIIDHPDEDTNRLASRISEHLGRRIRPDAYRKQVSRARCLLAQALIQEVAQTLDDPSTARVEEELRELELWPYVKRYIPPNWTYQK